MLCGSEKLQNRLVEGVRGAAGQDHRRIKAGHFIQESAGEEVARILLAFVERAGGGCAKL